MSDICNITETLQDEKAEECYDCLQLSKEIVNNCKIFDDLMNESRLGAPMRI